MHADGQTEVMTDQPLRFEFEQVLQTAVYCVHQLPSLDQ
jgi:hypothetical protein